MALEASRRAPSLRGFVTFAVVAVVWVLGGACGTSDGDRSLGRPATVSETPAASSPGGSGAISPDPTLPSAVATEDDPAPIGVQVVAGDWTLQVLEVVDADDAELLAPVSGFPSPGSRFVAVRYELVYGGAAPGSVDPFLPRVVGPDGTVHDVFTTSCVLDGEAAPQPLQLGPGESGVTAACFDVPFGHEMSRLLVVFEHFVDGGAELWFGGA